MARSRGSFRGRSAARRKTGWEEGPGTQTLLTINSSTTNILGLGQTSQQDGITVVRIRGVVELALTLATAVGDGFAGAIGIGKVSGPAFAIGATAVPMPIDEIEWEGWMWHQFFSIHATKSTPTEKAPTVIEIDSKAMRKFDSQETMFCAIQAVETGTAELLARLGTRMLLKLP